MVNFVYTVSCRFQDLGAAGKDCKTEVGSHVDNKRRNRYKNILPCKYFLLCIFLNNCEANFDYDNTYNNLSETTFAA